MSSFNRKDIADQIRDRALKHGVKTQLAKALGISRQAVHSKLQRDQGFTDEELDKAADFLGLERFGRAGTPSQAGLAEIRAQFGPGSGFVLVPRYDVAASAGPGSFADREKVIDYMAFREEFMRRTLAADPRKLVLITAWGDSMEPTISDGDLLLIDTGVERFIGDAIYIVHYADVLMVKRVQQPPGIMLLKSDNPLYEPYRLGPADAGQVRVAGRVRWIGRLI